MTSTGNVYDKAREVLRERGWVQYSAGVGDPDSATCLLGALAIAKTGDSYGWGALGADLCEPVARVIREQYPDIAPHPACAGDTDLPWWWNDMVAESPEQVDMVLDKAARIEDEQAATR